MLIPTALGSAPEALEVVSPSVREEARRLSGLIAESRKGATVFFKQAGLPPTSPPRAVRLLNEHTRPAELEKLLAPMLAGESWGLVSDGGSPAVADPGAELVLLAHRHGVRVRPLAGPSSPVLALMASGLGGQRFAFHGYLPRDTASRRRTLKDLESSAARHIRTEIWMETPYRNMAVFEDALAALEDNTFLSVASDLTLPTEDIQTRRVSEWKSAARPDLKNRPTIFLLGILKG